MTGPRIFRTPRDVIWGRGSLAYLENITGRQALIVTDPAMVRLGVAKRAQQHLATSGCQVTVFADVEPEPSSDTVNKIVAAHGADDFDVIVGLGGGSAIDAGKAFRIFYEYPELDVDTVLSPASSYKIPFRGFSRTFHVCISSTSGTGSDASYATVITHSPSGLKVPILHQDLIPDMTICDPDLSETMPPEVRLDSGLDALTHAVESYINDRTNDFSRSLSLQAATLIMQHLLMAALKNDPRAREHVHYAATLAGMGFSNSANGIAHTIADKVGPFFKLTHGLACAIALPYTIRYNRHAAAGLLTDLARTVGYRAERATPAGIFLADEIAALYRKLGVPMTYLEAGVPEREFQKKIPDFVDRSLNFPPTLVNPRKSTAKELSLLYAACLSGDASQL